jgi:hypothetical protein
LLATTDTTHPWHRVGSDCLKWFSVCVCSKEDANNPKYRRSFNAPRQVPGAAPIPIIREGHVGRRLGARLRVGTQMGGFTRHDAGPLIDAAALLAAAEAAKLLLSTPPAEVKPEIKAVVAPTAPEYVPLVIQPTEEDIKRITEAGGEAIPIIVEPVVGVKLRPHQREGVQFMVECVLSQRNFEGSGAILADDMGLGKTLQSVALMFTLLRQVRHVLHTNLIDPFIYLKCSGDNCTGFRKG